MAHPLPVVTVLGGSRVIGPRIKTLNQLANRLREGLPYEALESVMDALDISREALAETLQLPLRTLARRKSDGVLQPDESDRLYRLARVFAHAIDVFENQHRAASWLKRPNRALDGEAPIQRLDTDIGVHQVNDTLGRIEHGIYA